MAAPTDAARPPRVTAVTPDPRRPGTVRVEAEGGLLLTVPVESAARFGATPGARLAPEPLAGLARASDREAAFRTALRCLERRGYAVRDLARRLVLKGHPPEAAEHAVEEARRLGLLDDEAFARQYIQSKFARGRGPARLRRELTLMGVPAALVDRLLAEAVPPGAERDRMQALARRRARQLAGLPGPVRYRRVVAYLARRGFTGGEVRRAVRALLEPEATDPA